MEDSGYDINLLWQYDDEFIKSIAVFNEKNGILFVGELLRNEININELAEILKNSVFFENIDNLLKDRIYIIEKQIKLNNVLYNSVCFMAPIIIQSWIVLLNKSIIINNYITTLLGFIKPLFDPMLLSLIILDSDYNLIYINPAAANILKFDNFYSLIGKNLKNFFNLDVNNSKKENATNSNENDILFIVNNFCDKIKSEGLKTLKYNGSIYYYCLLIIDETKLHVCQQNQSFIFYQTLINTIDPICVIDKNLKFILINNSFVSVTGYKAEELIGLNFKILLFNSTWYLLRNIIASNCVDEYNTLDYSLEIVKKNRESFTARIRIYKLCFNGNDYKIICFEDITEKALSQYNLILKEKTLIKKNESFERELQYAQMVLQEIIPGDIEKVDYLDIRYKYLPLEAIGGDLFFLKKLDNKSYSIFIGDVAGHGISAALFLTLVKSCANRLIPKFGLKPNIFFNELNKELSINMGSYFLTAIYGFFSLKYDHVIFTFSRGGHPPPMVIRKITKKVETIVMNGKPIGMLKETKYYKKSIVLNPGDRILFYTDGILEIKNDENKNIGLKGFQQVIELYTEMNIDEFLKNIFNDLYKYKGTNYLEDDIVLLIIEVKTNGQ